MPILVDEPPTHAPIGRPAVVRIGPDRTLLDPPWEMWGCTVAHVWPCDHVAGGWARVEWPVDEWSHRPIAPLDLHLGHVLEFWPGDRSFGSVRYAIVAGVDEQRTVLVAAESAAGAASIARHVVDTWWASQLAAAEEEWRGRIVRAGQPTWTASKRP